MDNNGDGFAVGDFAGDDGVIVNDAADRTAEKADGSLLVAEGVDVVVVSVMKYFAVIIGIVYLTEQS